MPVVRIPSVLRKHTDGAAKIDVDGTTVREVFAGLIAIHPELGESLLADGDTVRGFINVYVNDEDIRYIGGLDSPCGDSDEIAIMPAVAGGSAQQAPR